MKTGTFFVTAFSLLTFLGGCMPQFTPVSTKPRQKIPYTEYGAIDELIEKYHYREALARAESALALNPMATFMQKRVEQARESVIQLDGGPASMDEVLDRMKTTDDDVDRIRWYRHQYNDKRFGTRMDLYIGQNIDTPTNIWMRLVPRFISCGWLFPNGFTVVTSNHRFDWNGCQFKRNSDISGSGFLGIVTTTTKEWVDLPVKDKEYRMIEAIIADSEATLRFRSEEGNMDYTFCEMDRLIYQDMLTAFKVLQRNKNSRNN